MVVRKETSQTGYMDKEHTELLSKVSSSGSLGLEEQSLVLLGGESDSHLTTQGGAIAIATGLVLSKGVVNLLSRHD
jgi:hypothetical protein